MHQPVSVDSQCKLVSGWRLSKRRSVPPNAERLYFTIQIWQLLVNNERVTNQFQCPTACSNDRMNSWETWFLGCWSTCLEQLRDVQGTYAHNDARCKLPTTTQSQIHYSAAEPATTNYTVSQKNRTPATFCNNSNSPGSVAIDFDKNNR